MKIQLEQDINASAETVWEIVGRQFADIANWASSIDYSRAITADQVPAGIEVAPSAPVPGRTTPNPLGELTEVLTMYSDEQRQFRFWGAGLPPIVKRMENTTRVVELDSNRSRVTFTIEGELIGVFKILDPLVQQRFATSKRGPAGVIEDLKHYAETIK